MNKDKERDARSKNLQNGFVSEEGAGVDWLESQKNNVYAYGYESIFRTGH